MPANALRGSFRTPTSPPATTTRQRLLIDYARGGRLAPSTTLPSSSSSSSAVIFQPCIHILESISLAHHGAVLPLQSNQPCDDNNKCLIYDPTGQANSIYYNLSTQEAKPERIRFVFKAPPPSLTATTPSAPSSSSPEEQFSAVLLKSRYIAPVKDTITSANIGHTSLQQSQESRNKVFDLRQNTQTSLSWWAPSSLATMTSGCTVLHVQQQNRYDSFLHHGIRNGIYVLGGENKTNLLLHSDVQFFPLEENDDVSSSPFQQQQQQQQQQNHPSWTALPNLKIPRKHASAVALNGKLYVLGGIFWDPFKQQYRDCPFTEIFDGTEWTFGPSLTIPRHGHAAVAVGNDCIVVLGGARESSQQQHQQHHHLISSLVDQVEIWHVGTNFFALLPQKISPSRTKFTAIVAKPPGRTIDASIQTHNIYLIGGGTRAVGKVSLDCAKLTVEEMMRRIPLMRPEAAPAPGTDLDMYSRSAARPVEVNIGQQRNNNNSSSKNGQTTITTANSFGTNANAASLPHHEMPKQLLPQPPALPEPPVGTTLVGRLNAMSQYIEQVQATQEQYQTSIQESKAEITQHYEMITNHYQRLCQQDIELVQSQGHAWFEGTTRLIQNAKKDAAFLQEQVKEVSAAAQMSSGLKDCSSADAQFHSFLKKTINRDSNVYEDDIPSMLRCPLTLDLMKDPVVASDGNTYERSALELWFRNCRSRYNRETRNNLRWIGATMNNNDKDTYMPRSPLTGATLPNETFFPVHGLRSVCLQYAKELKEKERQESVSTAVASTDESAYVDKNTNDNGNNSI